MQFKIFFKLAFASLVHVCAEVNTQPVRAVKILNLVTLIFTHFIFRNIFRLPIYPFCFLAKFRLLQRDKHKRDAFTGPYEEYVAAFEPECKATNKFGRVARAC